MAKSYNPKSGAYVVHSLNKGATTPYALGQFRMTDGKLHIQLRCPKYPNANRKYGMAFDVSLVPPLRAKFIETLNWCMTGTLVELTDNVDAEEAKNEAAEANAKIVPCDKCGGPICACGACHLCNNLDENGHLVKATQFKITGKETDYIAIPKKLMSIATGEDEEDEDTSEYTCLDCGEDLCPDCNSCHSCMHKNKHCEALCPACDDILCGECGHCHYCDTLGTNCQPKCGDCDNDICSPCGKCHVCCELDDECYPIPGPDTPEYLEALVKKVSLKMTPEELKAAAKTLNIGGK